MLTINNTLDGYLKDVEIKGNTIQDTSNLADIKSVGDKVEGQELYEIPVLSCGKNLFDINGNYDFISWNNSIVCNPTVIGNTLLLGNTRVDSQGYKIKVKPNTNYVSYVKSSNGEFRHSITDLNGNKLSSGDDYSNSSYISNKSFNSGNNEYILFILSKHVKNDIVLTNIQLEEGTVATPYEPYQEDKLTILSPVQLEKVGDVADRIIEKDGVLGVEKNVETYAITGNSGLAINSVYTTFVSLKGRLDDIKDGVCLCDTFATDHIDSFWSPTCEGVGVRSSASTTGSTIALSLSSSRIGGTTLDLVNKYLNNNPITIKYATTNPTFIPLPHDQQVKLRTFANKTNISFLTEIEGTIKAQVPKSLGATVNTHTEQINNLNKELDRVKKLEESTVSTVTTESDFTTVEATSNGYFKDVKLEGKTLVVNANNEIVEPGTEGATLKSVGQDVDEIVVSSVNHILLNEQAVDEDWLQGMFTGGSANTPYASCKAINISGHKYLYSYYIYGNTLNSASYIVFFDKNKQRIGSRLTGVTLHTKIDIPNNACYVRLMAKVGEGKYTNTRLIASTKPLSMVTINCNKSDKKRLLYYNEETQTWEKPVLHEWDSIEKHADGKYYYHVRSKEGDYVEGDESLNDCITDLTVSVKKLAEEKVYECTNIDLITYANETNYIVESGAISPKSTFEIHCNISNVVSMLQRKVSISESNLLTSNGGGNGDRTHSNLNVLNNITQTKVNEWNSKADSTHSHSEYANYSHTHNASEIEGLENVDIDLSDYYTKSETYNKTEIDSKIANMGAGGSVDLSNYYTKSETDEAMNNKANKVHTHNEYLTELPTHTHSEYLTELPSHEHEQYLTEHQDISHKADKTDIYTKFETDNKISEEIAKAQLGGSGEVDLSAYATKTYVDNEISKIELKEGLQGEKGDKGEQGIQGLKGDKGDKGDTGEKGEKGDAFTYEDFTPEQLVLLKGEQGEKGDKGDKGDEYDDTEIRGLISSLSKRIELLESRPPSTEIADIKLLYNFNNLKRGYAEGTISLQTSGEANAGKYYIKWADENGELSEYEEITVFEMFGVNAIQTYNFIKLNLIPIEASRIVAIKDNVIKASFDIPSNKRITDSKKLSFGLISDMHVDGSGGSSSEANDDFVRALKYFDSKQVDMNILTGDAVNNGLLVDLEKFKSLKGSSTNVPLYVCRGNHDTYNDCNVDNFTNYIEENGLHFEKEIKGDKYLFIGLNAEDFTNPFRRDSMEWLKTKLEEYKNQRVFLMQHVFVGETGNIAGLYPHSDGFDMTEGTCSKEFVDLLSKYRNVIMFTGHSHLDFELQRLGENANVALRTKTLCHRVHTPSTSKPRKNDISTEDIPDNTYTYREGSQGYLVDVYDTYIVLHGIDFEKGLLLPYAQYILDTTPILIEGDDNISSEYKLLSETTSFSLGSLSSSGEDRESSSSQRTDFIELNERDNKTFILPRGVTYLRICIYDENKTFLKLNEENDNNETPSKTDEIRNLENIAGAKYIKLKGQGDIENIRFNGSI